MYQNTMIPWPVIYICVHLLIKDLFILLIRVAHVLWIVNIWLILPRPTELRDEDELYTIL